MFMLKLWYNETLKGGDPDRAACSFDKETVEINKGQDAPNASQGELFILSLFA